MRVPLPSLCLLVIALIGVEGSASAEAAGKKRPAQPGVQAPSPVSNAELQGAIHHALRYLEANQVKETRGLEQFAGEWPSTMSVERRITTFSGVRAHYDSNFFTSAWVHNLLAESFVRDPSLTAIPSLLEKARENLLAYRREGSFNFWRLYPDPDRPGKFATRPNHFPIASRFYRKASIIANDADDTAVGYIALRLQEELLGVKGLEIPDRIGPVFAKWRDRRRSNVHVYNLAMGWNVDTKAFLTWLAPEPNWSPIAWIPRNEHGEVYMPLGANDVDCIVNANVLDALARFGELETTEGSDAACRFINRQVRNGNQGGCGNYYPNHFNLHYSVARAMESGVACLDESRPKLLHEVMHQQRKDGSWLGLPHEREAVMSSLYALEAVARWADPADDRQMLALERGVRWLLSKRLASVEGTLDVAPWEPGVFFSGGSVLRTSNVWRSGAVTAALAMAVLQTAREKLRQGGLLAP
jgi:hypothetical protein